MWTAPAVTSYCALPWNLVHTTSWICRNRKTTSLKPQKVFNETTLLGTWRPTIMFLWVWPGMIKARKKLNDGWSKQKKLWNVLLCKTQELRRRTIVFSYRSTTKEEERIGCNPSDGQPTWTGEVNHRPRLLFMNSALPPLMSCGTQENDAREWVATWRFLTCCVLAMRTTPKCDHFINATISSIWPL
jgi:hypothetical protein